MLYSYPFGCNARRAMLGMLGLAFSISAQAQTPVDVTSEKYTENFNSFSPTGTAYPTGWSGVRLAGSGTLNETLTPAVLTASSSAGAVYNAGPVAGTAGDTDRAIGSLASGSTIPAFGAAFTNKTATNFTKVDITGVMEQWRSASAADIVEKLQFEYSLDATSLTTGTWTAASALDLMELATTTTTAALLDGNAESNRKAFSASLTVEWQAGKTMWIRWKDTNDGGTDAIIALDDFTLQASSGVVVPTAPVISFGSAAVTVEENVGTVKIPVKLSAASTKEIMVDVVLATPAGTATSGDDFTFTKTTVTFPAGTTEKTVDVVIVDDNAQEAAETIILGLENAMPAADATIAAGTSTITINANDVPVVITVSPIGDLTVNDADGVPTQSGKTVAVKGIVYGVNTRTTGYQNVAIVDATGSIGLFSSLNVGDVTALQEGDEVEVTGLLTQFNGLSQIALTAGSPAAPVPNASIKVLSKGNALMDARAVTGALVEADESDLVKIGPVEAVDPAKWTTTSTASGYNVEVKNAAGTVYNVRINKGTDVYNTAAPTGTFTLTGVVTQFDSSTPYTEGYQIVPRRLSDIKTETSTANREPGFGRFVTLAPNPATNVVRVSLGTAGRGTTVEVLSLLGQRISRTTATGAEVKLTVGSLQQGVYLVRLTNAEGSVTRRFVKQ